MNQTTTRPAFRKMMVWGASVWTVIFLIAVVAVARPYIEWAIAPDVDQAVASSLRPPPLWQIVLPTWCGGLMVILIWVLIFWRWWPRRAWLAYLIAGAGGFLTMLPVLVFVAMPYALWQLVSALGIALSLIAAVRAGRSEMLNK